MSPAGGGRSVDVFSAVKDKFDLAVAEEMRLIAGFQMAQGQLHRQTGMLARVLIDRQRHSPRASCSRVVL